jgi:hypothetical protein
MIGIGLAHDITQHRCMASTYSLAFIGNQIDCFHPILMDAFKVSLPIFGFPAIGQLDAKNCATAWVHSHQYRDRFRKNLITGKDKILGNALFCG